MGFFPQMGAENLSDGLPSGVEEGAELKWGHLKFLALTPTI